MSINDLSLSDSLKSSISLSIVSLVAPNSILFSIPSKNSLNKGGKLDFLKSRPFTSISSNEVTLDLSVAQSFTITASDDINAFVLTNPPSGSTSFTVKILQDSTGGRSVGIDTFKNSGGTAIPVYWPGGGVLPIVTTTADRVDIYSFKLFDGDNVTTAGLYGVVGGQNFA